MLEVSVDFPGVEMDQFHLLPQQIATSRAWNNKGHLETLVLGKRRSSQTRIYDRGKKRKAKGQLAMGATTARVERILRLQPAPLLSQLPNLKNPFAALMMVVSDPGPPPGDTKPHYWIMFMDCAAQRGLTPALALLPEERRTAYRKWLAQNPTSWWDPDAIWKGWVPMLKELKIVSLNW